MFHDQVMICLLENLEKCFVYLRFIADHKDLFLPDLHNWRAQTSYAQTMHITKLVHTCSLAYGGGLTPKLSQSRSNVSQSMRFTSDVARHCEGVPVRRGIYVTQVTVRG